MILCSLGGALNSSGFRVWGLQYKKCNTLPCQHIFRMGQISSALPYLQWIAMFPEGPLFSVSLLCARQAHGFPICIILGKLLDGFRHVD